LTQRVFMPRLMDQGKASPLAPNAIPMARAVGMGSENIAAVRPV
jgi:hypothetical protein